LFRAFVLVNCDIGQEEAAFKWLKSIQYVEEIKVVYGVYDLIVRIATPDDRTLKETIEWIRQARWNMSESFKGELAKEWEHRRGCDLCFGYLSRKRDTFTEEEISHLKQHAADGRFERSFPSTPIRSTLTMLAVDSGDKLRK
jgi:sarcosine oxidase delta subunit